MITTPRSHRPKQRHGAMLVLIAICLPLCVIMAAFAVNVAWMQLVRTELRAGTDAAARAGAKGLSLFQDTKIAQSCAIEAAARNEVAGLPLKIDAKSVELGTAQRPNDTVRFSFSPGGARPNAVRVTAGRTTSSPGGPVNLLFANVFGVKNFKPIETATSTVLDRDICLVVDRSGSMMWTLTSSQNPPGVGECDPPHPTLSRWGAMTIAVDAFLTELDKSLQEEHVALVSYSSDISSCGRDYKISQVDCPLVNDYAPIRGAIADLSSRPVKGSTAISAGIDDGIKVLTGKAVRPFAVKTMVVLTDGLHNKGKEPILSAQAAAKKNIVIHTITFSADADIKRMQAVAAATGGRHFHADDQKTLVAIFRELAAMPVLITE